MVLIVPCWTWFSAPTSALTRNGLMWMMRDTRRRWWPWGGGIDVWFLVFPKTISSSHHIVSKESGKTPRFSREEMASNGDIVIHMKVTWFGYIWMCCLCWSNSAKSSRLNAGRMIVDPDKIGRWGSTWKRSDFFQVHNSISSSMDFEASQELTISYWLLERLHVFLNWYFLGWKSD